MTNEDITKVAEALHPLERKVLPHIFKNPDFDSLITASGLKDIEVMRALQWLQNKAIITLNEEIKELIELDINGLRYKEKSLPEKRFLEAIKDNKMNVFEIQKRAELTKEEVNVCIGVLKKKAALDIKKEDNILIAQITDNGKKLLEKESLEELFLQKQFPVDKKTLQPEEKFAYDNLTKRRQIIKTEVKKLRSAKLTPYGEEVTHALSSTADNVIDRLTPSMLKDGSWKKKKFRRYDIKINVPKAARGKRHFVRQALKYAKRVWTDLGFQEMTGKMLNTSFWNFDALFTAQDHPARDMQDTFFVKDPKEGKLPETKLIQAVKTAHEGDQKLGSKGWRYNWDPDAAKQNVLRTHTTVLSAKTLASLKKEDMPAKFFALGKNFRNETVDWSHLFEFNQTEGIVIDPNANFRHLLGYLKAFFAKMGFARARFRPAYFPYTEMSVEVDVFHPVHKKWFELGGAGIFRPEVVYPLLGEDIPVLAWGPGFDRLILEYYKITDIRDLYKNDLKQIRSMKEWMK